MKKNEMVQKMLCLSTAHLKEETMSRIIDGDLDAIPTYKKEDPSYPGEIYGCWVCVDCIDDADENRDNIPEDLMDAMKYARSVGASWIMFDRDAEVLGELALYDQGDDVPYYTWGFDVMPSNSAVEIDRAEQVAKFWKHYPENRETEELETFVACFHLMNNKTVLVSGINVNEDGYCYFTFDGMQESVPLDDDGFAKYLENQTNSGFSDGWFKTLDELAAAYYEDDVLQYLVKSMSAARMHPNVSGAQVYIDDREQLPVAIMKNIKVSFVNADEGINGDYNPEDPDDINLLRFDVDIFRNGEWEEVPDASYCTNLSVNEKMSVLVKAIKYLAAEYANVLSVNPEASVKKMGERLSWISKEDFE